MPKRALITGITGQDGSYLAEFLIEKGYEVHGIGRRVAIEDPEHRLWRIRHILDKIILHAASMESYASIFKVIDQVKPDKCYHLAAQSFVSYSFEDEFSTINTNINRTHFVLSAIKEKLLNANSILQEVQRCLVLLMKHHKMRIHPSIQGHLMVSQK
jgi:GDPmannose 4,6-dehydratase